MWFKSCIGDGICSCEKCKMDSILGLCIQKHMLTPSLIENYSCIRTQFLLCSMNREMRPHCSKTCCLFPTILQNEGMEQVLSSPNIGCVVILQQEWASWVDPGTFSTLPSQDPPRAAQTIKMLGGQGGNNTSFAGIAFSLPKWLLLY